MSKTSEVNINELIWLWKHHIYVVGKVQKVVSEKEIQKHLDKGWSVSTSVSPSSVIIEKPIDTNKVLLGIQKVIDEARQSILSE